MDMSATVNTRINPALKNRAELILHKIGLTSAEAVRLFYTQVCLNKGIPFRVNIPNKTTIKAMKDADDGRTHKAASVDKLFSELL